MKTYYSPEFDEYLVIESRAKKTVKVCVYDDNHANYHRWSRNQCAYYLKGLRYRKARL